MFVSIVNVTLKKDSVFKGVLENLATMLTPVKKVVGKNTIMLSNSAFVLGSHAQSCFLFVDAFQQIHRKPIRKLVRGV